jgi:hypothetical protein
MVMAALLAAVEQLLQIAVIGTVKLIRHARCIGVPMRTAADQG